MPGSIFMAAMPMKCMVAMPAPISRAPPAIWRQGSWGRLTSQSAKADEPMAATRERPVRVRS
ncbi:hypothetical protein D3C80_1654900 [compost metagenome]